MEIKNVSLFIIMLFAHNFPYPYPPNIGISQS